MAKKFKRDFLIRREKRVHYLKLKRIKRRSYLRLHPNNNTPSNIAQCARQAPDNVSYSKEDQAYRVQLPEGANLSAGYSDTIATIYTLRDAGIDRRTICNLDFSRLQEISTAAALILAAEIDLWNRRCKGRLKAATHTWHPNIRKLLYQMGFFELLNKQYVPSKDETKTSTVFLKFETGQVGVTDGGPIIKSFRKQIENVTKKKIEKHALFSALSEALTNVSQHAYSGSNHNGFKSWWVCGSYNQESSLLTIIFYDQGIGIPKTLKPARLPEYLSSGFGRMKDAERIQAAMEYGRSATKDPSRGKGLPDFLSLLNSQNNGRLRIFSRRGSCLFQKASEGKAETKEKQNSSIAIKGTLIEWIIEL